MAQKQAESSDDWYDTFMGLFFLIGVVYFFWSDLDTNTWKWLFGESDNTATVANTQETEQVDQAPNDETEQTKEQPGGQSPQEVSPSSPQSNARLTACPDCEGKVSKRAFACPHCGAPLIDGLKDHEQQLADQLAAVESENERLTAELVRKTTVGMSAGLENVQEAGQDVLTLKGHSKAVSSVSFSPDGKRIVSGSLDGTLKIWDAQTGQEMLTLKKRGGAPLIGISFSPDGRRIVSGSMYNILYVLDAETGEEIFTLDEHDHMVFSVSFSPDGKRIVSGSADESLKVWNAETGQDVLTLKGHSKDVSSVSFSPDGKRIVSGSLDETLKIWDAKTGQDILTLQGHRDVVFSVSFSPDGKRVVSGSGDKTVKIWDSETGQEQSNDESEPEASSASAPLSGTQAQPPTVDKTIVNSIGMKLNLIPAGEFQMGSPNADRDARDAEKPQHQVKITKPFYLGVYEVTQQNYEKVMGARPWDDDEDVREGADYPAVYVNHGDAVKFCRRLSSQEGVEYRLPTEAEWEYACRAGTTTAYSFGDDASKLGQYAWYVENSLGRTRRGYAHRVGQKLPNRWGLYDMHGNVMEWCYDWKASYGREKVVIDPHGPISALRRVVRGGSCGGLTSTVRSAYRLNGILPDGRYFSLGFRVARTYSVSP